MSVFTNSARDATANAGDYVQAVLALLGDREPLDVLRSAPAEFRSAVEGLSEEERSRPEGPGKWSVRQVLAHMADSEVAWAWRLRLILAQDRPVLTGYDQDAWAERLGYENADVEASLARFQLLRHSNVQVLERASPTDWQRVGLHPERGEESVEHLTRLYAGHDLLHQRQIRRIRDSFGD